MQQAWSTCIDSGDADYLELQRQASLIDEPVGRVQVQLPAVRAPQPRAHAQLFVAALRVALGAHRYVLLCHVWNGNELKCQVE